jgi:cyanate permease
MELSGPLDGWQWIFVVEGLVTIVFSILVFIFVPHFPAREIWLCEHDRALLLTRLEADKGKEAEHESGGLWLKYLVDYKIWLCTLLFFCADLSAGSLSSFNPTILSELGWTARRAQVMTIPVWVTGTTVALICNLLAGRLNKRWPFLFLAM